MDYPVTDSASEEAIPASALLVDSAISHCEKLRRVLELEEWVNEGRDNPALATPCRKWREEREHLLAELHLEQGS
jgi:hypothetical protein